MNDMGRLVAKICEFSLRLGYSPEEYLDEKLAELGGRIQLRMTPSGHLSDRQLGRFLESYLGREPTAGEQDEARLQRRSIRLSDAELSIMERQQNDRCANCGRFLEQSTQPHVDHRVPIALGGRDTLENLQLLCAQCNMGKGKIPVWQVGVPYMERRLTKRLRYCVLARASGRCQFPRCSATVATCELQPVLKMPASMGGAFVFDNLTALCSQHAESFMERRLSSNLEALQLGSLRGRPAQKRIAAIRMQQSR
jgi:hypothetical protein